MTFLTLCQLNAAELTGVVRFGGLPLPGATVIATQDGKRLSTITDGEGRYRFGDVADGTWNVEVGMQLFAAQKKDIAGAAEWDMQLLSPEELSKAAVAPAPGEPRLEVASAKPVAPPKPNAKNAPAQTNTRTPFQRTGLNATATAPAEQAPTESA